jgi:hypothetical protein
VSQIYRLKRRLVRYGIGYTFITLLGQLLPAGDLHFLYHIWLFILGYLIFFALSALGYWRALEN